MSNASDKARFYIEQTVPELREWERREIFSRAEISSISSQRSTYEHILASRDATAQTYARYITYEHNLAALLKRRIARKGLKNTTNARDSQRRIFGILERATSKFHGDLPLWTQYLEFCKTSGAHKRHEKVLAEVLRLFPTRGEIWRYAARNAEKIGDVRAARAFLIRGVRFNEKDWDTYLEWCRIEMRWLARLSARKQILGLDRSNDNGNAGEGEEASRVEHFDTAADQISLPTITTGEIQSSSVDPNDAENVTLSKLDSTPAMTGAIPIQIFDSAMQKSNRKISLAKDLFNLFAPFSSQVSCTSRILDHVFNTMREVDSSSPTVKSCDCRLPLIGISLDSPNMPGALAQAVKLVKQTAGELRGSQLDFAKQVREWLEPLSEDGKLVPELKRVVDSTLRQLSKNS
ncbi:MAG: U3 snoRNP protein [Alyxoria varia]|nr:MAG: U3 snoRNP protein [Alyxoria varia]